MGEGEVAGRRTREVVWVRGMGWRRGRAWRPRSCQGRGSGEMDVLLGETGVLLEGVCP